MRPAIWVRVLIALSLWAGAGLLGRLVSGGHAPGTFTVRGRTPCPGRTSPAVCRRAAQQRRRAETARGCRNPPPGCPAVSGAARSADPSRGATALDAVSLSRLVSGVLAPGSFGSGRRISCPGRTSPAVCRRAAQQRRRAETARGCRNPPPRYPAVSGEATAPTCRTAAAALDKELTVAVAWEPPARGVWGTASGGPPSSVDPAPPVDRKQTAAVRPTNRKLARGHGRAQRASDLGRKPAEPGPPKRTRLRRVEVVPPVVATITKGCCWRPSGSCR